MKKGINEWSFPAGWSIERKLEMARHFSFEGVELAFSEESFLTFQRKEKDLDWLMERLQENHLQIPSIATDLLWKYPLTHSDPAVREKGRQIVKEMIRLASYLRAETILVVPGMVDEKTPYDLAYERSQTALLNLAAFAKEHQVTIAVENVWNRLLLSPLEMRRWIDEMNHESVKVYFDVGNVLAYGYPEQWIRILGHRIEKVHVKDFRREIGTIHGFLPLLQGDVPWDKVMGALGEIGYGDYLTIEVPPHPRYPVESIKQGASALDAIMGRGDVHPSSAQ